LASAAFSGMAVIGINQYLAFKSATFSLFFFADADPYIPGGGGAQYWVNQNNLSVIRSSMYPLC
jgi:hypothetical protein